MSYEFYKVVHFAGLFLTFSAIGAYFINGVAGETGSFPGKKIAGMLHGIGLAIAFIAGFGLIAKMGFNDGWPVWIYLKLVIWLLLGAVIVLPRKFPKLSVPLWIVTILLGACAAYLARYKPF